MFFRLVLSDEVFFFFLFCFELLLCCLLVQFSHLLVPQQSCYCQLNHPMEDITDRYGRVSIEDDEEVGLVIEQPEESDVPTSMQWCFVGRFLTNRMINRHSMKTTLAMIWRPIRGVSPH